MSRDELLPAVEKRGEGDTRTSSRKMSRCKKIVRAVKLAGLLDVFLFSVVLIWKCKFNKTALNDSKEGKNRQIKHTFE